MRKTSGLTCHPGSRLFVASIYLHTRPAARCLSTSTLPVCCVISKLALTSAEIIDHAVDDDDDDDDTPQDSGAQEEELRSNWSLNEWITEQRFCSGLYVGSSL